MTDFPTWFTELRAKRKRWVDASQENQFERGIWNATVQKYADPSHFVFELLQNAEDEGATRATFILEEATVTFVHDGRSFDRRDIDGITGIGNTTKLDQANKIGSFGIGFKSVYVITDRPEIHCTIDGASAGFAIVDLVVPEFIEPACVPGVTRIVLPLRPKDAVATLAVVEATLAEKGPRALLFLTSMHTLEWIHGERGATYGKMDAPAAQAGEEGKPDRDGAWGRTRSLRAQPRGGPAVIDRYLVLERAVPKEGSKSDLSVRIALRLNGGGDVIKENDATRLCVFFETEEATGLFMHLHGPFKLTDNRANVKRGDPWNEKLVDELAALLADNLPRLRDAGMIKRGLLEALPNSADALDEPWQRLTTAVTTAFRTQPLVPAFSGGYAAATGLIRGPADFRQLLGDDGLDRLGGSPGMRWTLGTLNNQRDDKFVSGLGIAEWGAVQLLASLSRSFSTYAPSGAATQRAHAWFDERDDEELQRLYLLIEGAMRVTKNPNALAQLAVIRLENGRRVRPSQALLPPAEATAEEEAAGQELALVRRALVRSGRTRGKEVDQFLRRIGVKEVGERDYVAALVKASYGPGAPVPTAERHLRHMRRFLKWWSEHKEAGFLNDVAFLRTGDVAGFAKASSVYVDEPFRTTGLAAAYDGSIAGRDRRPLWNGYAKLKRSDFLDMLRTLGVEDKLTVYKRSIQSAHPRYTELVTGFPSCRTTTSAVNEDFFIHQLSALMARRDIRVSRLIWNMMAASPVRFAQASYTPNQKHVPHRQPSTLALALANSEWIPTKDGSFCKPHAITAADLASEFAIGGCEPC